MNRSPYILWITIVCLNRFFVFAYEGRKYSGSIPGHTNRKEHLLSVCDNVVNRDHQALISNSLNPINLRRLMFVRNVR